MSDTEEFTAEEKKMIEAMEKDEPAEIPDDSAGEETKEESPQQEKSQEDPEETSKDSERPPENFVPQKAMHAEREERKKAQSELKEANAAREELERRIAALEAARSEETQEKPPEWVDPIVDPDGHRRWNEYQNQKLTEELSKLQEHRNKTLQEQQELQAKQERQAKAIRYEAAFKESTPDYPEAAQFLVQSREKELRAMGYVEREIQAQIAHDANEIYNRAEQLGENPAKFLYDQSVARGYVRADKNKIQALKSAQEATQSVGTSSGGPQNGGLTVERIANMSEEEFALLDPAQVRKVMGG
ncbi:MAG: hypothetical protein AAFR21_11595 [Pseudomonadota bacterium]